MTVLGPETDRPCAAAGVRPFFVRVSSRNVMAVLDRFFVAPARAGTWLGSCVGVVSESVIVHFAAVDRERQPATVRYCVGVPGWTVAAVIVPRRCRSAFAGRPIERARVGRASDRRRRFMHGARHTFGRASKSYSVGVHTRQSPCSVWSTANDDWRAADAMSEYHA